MKVKQNWWYKLHKLLNTRSYNDLRYYGQTNFCTWLQSNLFVVVWLLLSPVLTAGVLVIIWFAVQPFVFLVTGALGIPVSWVDVELSLTALGCYFIMVLVYVFQELASGTMEIVPSYLKFKSSGTKQVKPKEDGFLKTWYKAHKEKFCPIVYLGEYEK